MDLDALSPIIEEIIKSSLMQKSYEFGHPTKGMGNRVATGNLMNSIKAQVEETQPGIQIIQITAFGKRLEDTYAYWLINDRKAGKFPNVTAIKDWIRNKKSFKIRDLKTGKYIEKNEVNINRVAFLVGRSMMKNGYQNKPQNFITISIEKIMADPRVMEIIGDAAVEELINTLEGI
tara:strand:+ start:11880 stop:12407 length:528 start_codon:yes stop_codon:yes gene_type:complete